MIAENAIERDKWMSPQEALEFGLLDKVLDHPPSITEEEEKDSSAPKDKS